MKTRRKLVDLLLAPWRMQPPHWLTLSFFIFGVAFVTAWAAFALWRLVG